MNIKKNIISIHATVKFADSSFCPITLDALHVYKPTSDKRCTLLTFKSDVSVIRISCCDLTDDVISAVDERSSVVEIPLDGDWRWFAVHYALERRVGALVDVEVGNGLDFWCVFI